MRRFLFLLLPIFAGLIVFSVSLFLLSQNTHGNGALQVTSLPSSTVYLNGKNIGKTPLCRCEGKDMPPSGDYTVKLVPTSGDNLFPYEEHITIAKGVLTVVDRLFGVGEFSSGSVISLVPIEKNASPQLFINSFPPSTNITLDGNSAGVSPLILKSVTASDHDILLTKTGYKDKTIHVHSVPGYQLKAIVTLSLASSDASQEAGLQVTPSPTTSLKQKVIILDTETGFLKVHSDSSLFSPEIARVKPGDIYDFLAEQDGLYQIQVTASMSGWISNQYAKKQ